LLPGLSGAGVYNSDTEVTYKEYWVDHSEFTGGCGPDLLPGGTSFIEPSATCSKTLTFNIPDDPASAVGGAKIYLDLWRNRDVPSATFTLNGNATVYAPNVGAEWSRTPYVGDINQTELVQGLNTITFTGNQQYLASDIAIRLYYTDASPLTPGSGSDVSAPAGSLTSVGGIAPGVGGTLDITGNSLTLTASNPGGDADYIEFLGYYYGYDEDNDAEFIDWHNIKRNTFNPGSTGTIDHIGTDTTAPYSVTWDLSQIPNQSGARFKVRIVDAAGNVREAAGGVSADFRLSRSRLVESYLTPNFVDDAVHNGGASPDTTTRSITLPNDLSDVTAAYLVGAFTGDVGDLAFSGNPSISVNGNAAFSAFNTPGEDTWGLSIRSIPVSDLVGGSNQIDYTYSGTGFGEFIEKPGPMMILERSRSPAPAVGFVGDDFNTPSLDTGVWSFIDPLGDSTMVMTGTQLELSVPAGVRHDLWENANEVPRILQPAADTDFELEVKMDSAVTLDAQMQGIIIQEDVNEFLRFEFFGQGGVRTAVYAASFVDGVPTVENKLGLTAGMFYAPIYMRVSRVGDNWTQSFSTDGITYNTAVSFTHAMRVRDVGVYAGNANTTLAVYPGYTATFDYFHAAPIITAQPASVTVNEGGSATFTVSVTGTPAPTFQWQKDGVNIASATSASYTTPPTTAADNGSRYQVVVSNSVNSATSAAATLTVNVAPAITAQPVDQSVVQGQMATFSVAASGTAPLSYQWSKNGSPIAAATSASYTTPATTLADDGSIYTVAVSNVVSSVTSASATLSVTTVAIAPSITAQPVNQTVNEGQTATFHVVATGTSPLSYQWQKNSVDIAGATSASYTTPATNPSDDGSAYQVVVSNAVGSATSTAATLNVNVAPTIGTQPSDQTVTEGATATFRVVASGTPPLSYQWQKNGVAISGATGDSYTSPATTLADDGGSYRVVVTNAVGSVTSAAATLSVTAAATSSGGGGGGCVLDASADPDPTLLLLILMSLGYLFRQRSRKTAQI
jgi:hypothetical protein